MNLGGEALATLRKKQHQGVEFDEVAFSSIVYAWGHSWLINEDGGSMTLWKITAKIEPKLEHYVRNLQLDDDVKCIKWVMFSSRIDILHWRVKEMSFSPKNEVLGFRAPLGRPEEHCGGDCESTRQVWQKWRAGMLRPTPGCSEQRWGALKRRFTFLYLNTTVNDCL